MSESELLHELKGEKKVDDQMVIDAKIKIKSIITEHFGAAAYEVVDYLVDTFFDGDKKNLKLVKLNGHKTFQKLLEAIHGETGKSKSWVYESIKLWHDRELLGDYEPYMQLSISHRALLLKVSNIDDKKKYAQKFAKLPYVEAKEIALRESPATDYSILKRLINHPDEKMDDYKKKISKTSLKNHFKDLKIEQKKELVGKAKKRVEKLEKTIAEQKELLEKAKLVQSKLNAISAAVSGDRD